MEDSSRCWTRWFKPSCLIRNRATRAEARRLGPHRDLVPLRRSPELRVRDDVAADGEVFDRDRSAPMGMEEFEEPWVKSPIERRAGKQLKSV